MTAAVVGVSLFIHSTSMSLKQACTLPPSPLMFLSSPSSRPSCTPRPCHLAATGFRSSTSTVRPEGHGQRSGHKMQFSGLFLGVPPLEQEMALFSGPMIYNLPPVSNPLHLPWSSTIATGHTDIIKLKHAPMQPSCSEDMEDYLRGCNRLLLVSPIPILKYHPRIH